MVIQSNHVPYGNIGGGVGDSLYGSNIQATANLTGGGKRRRKRTNKKRRTTKRKMRRSRGKRSKHCDCKVCECNPCECTKKSKHSSKRRKTLASLRASLKKYN